MERELRSIRQEAQSQERTIQGLTESNSTKDREASARRAHPAALTRPLFDEALLHVS